MAHLVSKQKVFESDRVAIFNIFIRGDGSSADLSASTLIDLSADLAADRNGNACTDTKAVFVGGNMIGFSSYLLWDATTDVPFYVLPEFTHGVAPAFGNHMHANAVGIPNNAGTGKTGDINITTIGLSAVTDVGTIWLVLDKRY
jgi:hypothetical protein